MRNRNIIAIATIILALALVELLFLSGHTILTDKVIIPPARITSFVADMSWYNPVGVTMGIFFNITVQNTENHSLENVSVSLHRLSDHNIITNDSLCDYDYFDFDGNNFALKANESRVVRVVLFTDLEHLREVSDSNYVAIVKVNNEVVDLNNNLVKNNIQPH
jgi:hypothetical protein